MYDATLAATPADGDPAEPVGLGAFKFVSYTPGNGNTFESVRNDEYWRGPNGITGEDLPYLDGIDFVVAVDADSRTNATRSGQFDLMMTANGDTIDQFLDDDDFKVDSSTKFGDTGYTMLNTATGDADPEGANADNPLLNVNCRRALALAIDTRALVRGAQRRPVPAGQRTVPAGLDRLPGGQRLPAVRRGGGASRDGRVPVGVGDGSASSSPSTRPTTRSTWSRTR